MNEEKINLRRVEAFVENVHVKGLKHTKDEYVKHHLKEIFQCQNFEDILHHSQQAQQKLASLECFKNIDILIDGSKDNSKAYNVTYDVEELSRVRGGIHTSIGNNEGTLHGSVSFPNLFGKGEKGSFEYAYGSRSQSDYRFTYQSPINMNPDKKFSFSLFQTSNEYPWSKFRENETGLVANITKPFEAALGPSLLKGEQTFSYEAIWRNVLSSYDAAIDVREQSGHSLKSSLKYMFTVDRRNNIAVPNDGGFLKSSYELAGLGGDVKFFKTNTDYQYTKTLFKYLTSQFTLSAGFMKSLNADQSINISDRFFLGGPLTLRGFSMRGAGPHKDDCSLGNDSYWLAGFHIYTPLPFFHKEEKLSWLKTHSFINFGNILSLNELKSSEKPLEYLRQDTRLSIGTGIVIRFASIARVELNYAIPLRRQQNDKFINGVQFGVGISFN